MKNNTDPNTLRISETESAWIMSSPMLSVPLGALTGGVIMDYIGRINLLRLMALPSIAGYTMIATSNSVPMLILGRVLTGIAIIWGMNSSMVYVAETSTPEMRGPLSGFLMLNISLGIVLVIVKGWLLNWRIVAWLANIYMLTFVILIMFLPESPAWLISKNQVGKAKKALHWFSRHQPQIEDESLSYPQLQLAEIQRESLLNQENGGKINYINILIKLRKMFWEPTGYKPLLIMLGVAFFQQYCGLYVLVANGVVFCQEMGVTTDPYLASVYLGLVRLIMTIIYTWLIKKYNRRLLLTISNVGMAASIAISGLFTTWVQQNTTTFTWIPIVMLLFYFAFGSVGIMFIPTLLVAEVFPIEIRGLGQSIITSAVFLFMFSIVQNYYILINFFNGSSGMQYFFSAMSLLSVLFCYIFVPETRNKKLSDIEAYFVNNTVYITVPMNCKHSQQFQKETQGLDI